MSLEGPLVCLEIPGGSLECPWGSPGEIQGFPESPNGVPGGPGGGPDANLVQFNYSRHRWDKCFSTIGFRIELSLEVPGGSLEGPWGPKPCSVQLLK